MISVKTTFALATFSFSVGILGCDPVGPGATGAISLGKAVDPSGFKTLQTMAVVDTGSPFVPTQPVFTSPVPKEGQILGYSENLANMTFPHVYSLEEPATTTKFNRWRLFAWLSTKDAGTGYDLAPPSGAQYGTTTFEVYSCGIFGNFCNITTNVNVTIDQTVP